MRAIRRFTVRTALPEPLAPLGDLVMNLRWSWHPETSDLFAPSTRRPGGGRARPDPAARGGVARAAGPSWRPTATSSATAARCARRPHRVLLAGVRHHRGAAAVLRRPRHPRRRPPQGRQRPRRADHRRRPALPQRLLPAVAVARRLAAGDLPGARPARPADHAAARGRRAALRVASACPAAARCTPRCGRPRSAACRCCCSTPTSRTTTTGPREVTDRLYGGGSEHRLQQEMLLGIGGVRAHPRLLRRLTGHPEPEVFHTNEGHAGFLGVERIRELVEDRGPDLRRGARGRPRRHGVHHAHPGPGRHRPVPARPRSSSTSAATTRCPASRRRHPRAGRRDYDGGDPGVFNMAVMGLRLAQRANGVAKLHGVVSREMFNGLWPGFDADEVPITSITNGVHAPDLGRPRGLELAPSTRWGPESPRSARRLGVDRRHPRARSGPPRDPARAAGRRGPPPAARVWLQRGASPAELGWVDDVLDPDVLTIGFARRVPSYKRLTLMLRDPVRLKALLLDPERPVQIVIAGKSHPADDGGKKLIQQLVSSPTTRRCGTGSSSCPTTTSPWRSYLYPGCDVWLNNPLRPLEACGTSGMKAALNGGPQPVDPRRLVGRVVRRRERLGHPDRRRRRGPRPPRRPRGRRAVRPHRGLGGAAVLRPSTRTGLPTRWLSMVRHTLRTLGPKVLASRMVRDYVTSSRPTSWCSS
jgi:starch phosphorylase